MKSELSQTSAHGNHPYLRIKISGTLTCNSDLHIGDGEELQWQERQDLPADREPPDMDTDPAYHSVCWAVGKGPYLPASSLRGSLRSRLLPETARVLLGYVAPPEEGGGEAGKVRFYDAFWDPTQSVVDDKELPPFWSKERNTAARHGITLDPLTGTVIQGRLYSHELVPTGSRFCVKLEADNLTAQELAQLLALLEQWDGRLWSALGARRGKGWGQVSWKLDSVRVLTEVGLQQWLADEQGAELESFFNTPLELPLPSAVQIQPPIEIDYCLKPNGPILVNEPGYQRKNKEKTDHLPHHEYSRRPTGPAILPGKSLIGALRARAYRIVATIAHQHCNADPQCATDTAQTLVKALFGDTGQRGVLWISDAEAEGDEEHAQFFNAIDRFTGGVKGQQGEGALYQANARVGGKYRGKLLLEAKRLIGNTANDLSQKAVQDWWKGLLLLVVRDALEGELAVGWGKAKGYGAVHVLLKQSTGDWVKTWEEALAYVQAWGDPAQWLQALHTYITQKVERCPVLGTAPEGEPQVGVQP